MGIGNYIKVICRIIVQSLGFFEVISKKLVSVGMKILYNINVANEYTTKVKLLLEVLAC